jgi:hypothetical protein
MAKTEMDGIDDDLRMLRARGLELDRREWKNILKAARTQTGLGH